MDFDDDNYNIFYYSGLKLLTLFNQVISRWLARSMLLLMQMGYNLIMELLSPAGNLEKLKTAVRYGADAVYCGGGDFSLRAADTSFSLRDLASGVAFAHQNNCKVYLAMNIFAFDNDFKPMLSYLKKAVEVGIDAVIISDPGLLYCIKQSGIDVKVHLSTQANTTNSESVKFWHSQGVSRIIMSRELSLDQIAEIKKQVPEVELEIFVHGAMCVAYSGRCLLSKLLNDRSANRGLCAQPCRWEYTIREVGRKEELTIGEETRGTYILNSRDLCLVEHIPALVAAGIDSIKIEGRMKTAYYVAATTRVYRAALDRFSLEGSNYRNDPEWVNELARVSHRPYSTGFYLPETGSDKEYMEDSSYIRNYDFAGVVAGHCTDKNLVKISVRNMIKTGDILEVLDFNNPEIIKLEIKVIEDCDQGKIIESAHNGYTVNITPGKKIKLQLSENALVRRKISF